MSYLIELFTRNDLLAAKPVSTPAEAHETMLSIISEFTGRDVAEIEANKNEGIISLSLNLSYRLSECEAHIFVDDTDYYVTVRRDKRQEWEHKLHDIVISEARNVQSRISI